jgi:homoisocitrate dehydrogenase
MNLCIIPGDGIGSEVIGAAVQVLHAIAPDIATTTAEAGWSTFQQRGTALPDETLQAAQHADAVLFGAVASPSHAVAGYRSPIVALRRALDLYANIRPVQGYAPRTASGEQPPVDLVVVRENTEGLYAGRERLEDDGNTAIAERVITRRCTERIVQRACELAQQRAAARGAGTPPHLTIVHKANVLRTSDGLFRSVALEVTQRYPAVRVSELLVDVAAMHLAQSPQRFDTIVTTNMFGDILSDVACIHGGGLGLASSANLGDHAALFEPVHGAAPDIAGQGIANPLAAVGCVALLLEWLERRQPSALHRPDSSQRVREALAATLRHGPHTPDLGGTATTRTVTDALVARIQAG